MDFNTKQVGRTALLFSVAVVLGSLAAFPWLVGNIFSSTYLPHGFCFQWNARLLWQHVIADSIIWASYTFISLTLGHLVLSCRRQIPFQQVFLAFGAFIVACGFTHLLAIVVLWRPLYWLEGDVKLLTALASLLTAVALPFYVPRIRSLLRGAAQSAENERRFLAATNNSQDCFYILEAVRDASGGIADFRFAFVNANGARLVRRTPEEMTGQLLCEMVPVNRTGGFFEKYKEVVETGESLVDEFPIDDQDVDASWLRYQVVRLGDGVAVTTTDISERKRREMKSSENERRFLAAAESSLDSLYLLASSRGAAGEIVDFRIVFVNENAARLVSRRSEEMVGQLLCEIMPQNRSWGIFDDYKRVAETGEPLVREFPVGGFDGIACEWVKIQVVKLDDGVAVTASNIDALKRTEAERAKTFTRSLINSSPCSVIVSDLAHTITAINPAAEKMLWYKAYEVVEKETPLIFFDPVAMENLAKRLSVEYGTPVSSTNALFFAATRGLEYEAELNLVRKGGTVVTVQAVVTPLGSAEGHLSGFMITAYDVTDRKRREEYISHIAQHDALTGLPTRHLLLDRLTMMLARTRRFGQQCALLMIDLNRFKQINDLHGHLRGDLLLAQVAERFKLALREVDTIARMGGDEFVVLIADLDGPEGAFRVARKLLESLAAPFVLTDEISACIEASIGICMYPDAGQDAESMLRNADIAMYQAKSAGGDHIEFFSAEIARIAHQRQELEVGLREAVRVGEFELHYQPEVDLQTGHMVGLEALLRWRSKRLGNVPPAEFIPIAEETGLIQPIGAWVINKACQDIRLLNENCGSRLFIAVNLSPRQLEQPDLLKIVEQALAHNNLAPESLEIEITESILMSDSPKTAKMLEALRALGVRIAIDDFGTGFSSMSYLLRFSVDRLKIDRSFVRDCSTEANSSTVTSAIIALAHQLKLSVIAEGVETRDQVEFLRASGCDLVQGYYYSKPMPLNAVAAWQKDAATSAPAAPQNLAGIDSPRRIN